MQVVVKDVVALAAFGTGLALDRQKRSTKGFPKALVFALLDVVEVVNFAEFHLVGLSKVQVPAPLLHHASREWTTADHVFNPAKVGLGLPVG
jgi:hypothetical protein